MAQNQCKSTIELFFDCIADILSKKEIQRINYLNKQVVFLKLKTKFFRPKNDLKRCPECISSDYILLSLRKKLKEQEDTITALKKSEKEIFLLHEEIEKLKNENSKKTLLSAESGSKVSSKISQTLQ